MLTVVRTLSLTTSKIDVLFSDDLDPNIGINNVEVLSTIDSISDATIITVVVENDVLTITFSPIFPNAQYKIVFSSTTSQNFQTVNGEIIAENGNTNVIFIVSPGEEASPVRDAMLEVVPVVYEVDEPTLVRDLITTEADLLQDSLDSLQTVRSANYLSVDVEDERIVRGDGPTDRFTNGGVFEVLRVGSTPSLGTRVGSITFDATRENSFLVSSVTIVNSVVATLPADPISLQSIDVINETVSDDTNQPNFFDGLRIKVANRPVIQVISVTLRRNGALTPYNIETFGYALKSNRFDTDTASINVNLTDQEIDLSSSSLTGLAGGFLQPKAGDEILISYVHKRLGRDITTESVGLSRVREAVREPTPAILTVFDLDNAPIVLPNDTIPATGGVTFLNSQASGGNPAFTAAHPAFLREIAFDIARSPARPGEFSVDHNTGRVFVFGEDLENEGTGLNPPVANYFFREEFVEGLDFTFNSDRDEISINSTRNIIGIEAKTTFTFEDTFEEDEDFRVLSHVEALNERINNRLIGEFKVETLKK